MCEWKTASRQRRCQDRRCQRKQFWQREVSKWKCNNRKQEKWCQAKTVSRVWDVERRECQEKKVSRKRDAQREGCQERRQRKAAEMTSLSRDHDDIRKSLSGEKSVSSLWLQSCRQEGLSRFRNVRSKPDQEKVAAPLKDVESNECQAQTLSRDHAADSRASQAVRGRSYRPSLVFIGSSLSRNFRHPACPGSTCNLTTLFGRVYVNLRDGIMLQQQHDLGLTKNKQLWLRHQKYGKMRQPWTDGAGLKGIILKKR